MIPEKATEQGSNNYINLIYSSLPTFTISKSIDVIKLSIMYPDIQGVISNFLEDIGFKKISTRKLPKGNYVIKQTYKSDTDTPTVEIMYGTKACYLPVLVNIHDVNMGLLTSLDAFFRDQRIISKVSEVELAFDFDTADIYTLYTFLKSHLFQKYCGKELEIVEYSTTFYTDNIWKTQSKGMRVYLRPKEGKKEYVRMELVLKRKLIKRLGLELTLRNIDSLNLDRFFTFKFLNKERISNYLLWQNKQQIKEAEERRKGFGGLMKCHIRSYLSCLVDEEETLMSNVWTLKSEKGIVPNYSRFLEPLHVVNRDFIEKASDRKFIPDRCLEPPFHQERKFSKVITRPLKMKKVLS
jgi:hypothetical protein